MSYVCASRFEASPADAHDLGVFLAGVRRFRLHLSTPRLEISYCVSNRFSYRRISRLPTAAVARTTLYSRRRPCALLLRIAGKSGPRRSALDAPLTLVGMRNVQSYVATCYSTYYTYVRTVVMNSLS